MRNRYSLALALCLCAALVVAMAAQAAQQSATGKLIRYDGRVTVMSKDTQTITMQAKTGVVQVKYNDQTKFTYRNKPGTIDDVKEGRRIVALLDESKKDMVALRIDVREGK